VANGLGLSILHIGHSNLTGSSLHLKYILHVPRICKNLQLVYRLVFDNDVFVEFHRHFLCVKDKVTKKILLHGRSHGGLYPIPFDKASSSISHQASASVKVLSSQWHQRLGHPSNNVVHNIVKTDELSCSPDNLSLVCDACQRAKSHQLSYTVSSRLRTVPLELIHSDVWGPARVSSRGVSIMLVLWMTTLVSVGFICLNTNLMLNKFPCPLNLNYYI
jgi:histone deacetylase 1/2